MKMRSHGLRFSSVRTPSAKKNGTPVGAAAAGADERDRVADVAADVLLGAARDVAAERQRREPQVLLHEAAELGVGVGGVADRRDGALGGLDEPRRLGQRAGLAHGLVDRDVVDAGALAAAELVEQLARLGGLGEHVLVGDLAADLGAAVDRVQPPAAAACLAPLEAAVERVHVHGQRERPVDLHRSQQPPELGEVGDRGDVQDALEVLLDADEAAVVEIDRGGGDLLAQLRGGGRRGARVAELVELAEDLEAREVAGAAAGRVEAPEEQLGDLRSAEQPGGQLERLQVADDAVGVHERFAHDAPVVLEAARERRARQAAAAVRAQRAPVDLLGDGQRQVGDHDVGAEPHGGLVGGVRDQRLLVRGGQAAQRGGSLWRLARERAVDLLAGCVEHVAQQHRRGLDVELQALPGAQPARHRREPLPHALLLVGAHDLGVARRDLDVAHERALAGHQHAVAIERGDVEQRAGRGRLAAGLGLGASHRSHAASSSRRAAASSSGARAT